MKRLEEAKAGTEETVTIDTDVLKDSAWFDRGMVGNYLTKDIEMFDRAFENYISAKKKEKLSRKLSTTLCQLSWKRMRTGNSCCSAETKKAPETAVPGDESPFKATVISSANGAKVLNNLEKLAIKCTVAIQLKDTKNRKPITMR